MRWYLRYALTYRDLVEMMAERGLSVSHTTIMHWVHEYSPKLDKRIRPRLRMTGDSWRVDETYIRVRRVWMYLYRAVDKNNNVESDHRRIKRLVNHGLGFHSFNTARKTIRGYEAMHMIRKNQICGAENNYLAQTRFINSLFGIAA